MSDYQVGLSTFADEVVEYGRSVEGPLDHLAWFKGSPTLQLFGTDRRLCCDALVGEAIEVTIHDKRVCASCGASLPEQARKFCHDCTGQPPFTRCVMNPGADCTYADCPYPAYKRDACAHTFVVYLAAKDTVKVGITRADRRVTRWAEQGASHALVVGETPNRKAAGLVEDALGERFPTRSASSWYEPLDDPIGRLVAAAIAGADAIPDDPRLQACYFGGDHPPAILRERVVRVPAATDGVDHTRAASRPELEVGQRYDGTVVGVRGSVIMTDAFAFNTKRHQGQHVSIETTADLALAPEMAAQDP